ncbi:MAG: trypsin-like peptidase domain-containing protein [Myxococcales bacterium]|nr:trypsin-like peptidase domain-containing protein [Myxococcales bacterium]
MSTLTRAFSLTALSILPLAACGGGSATPEPKNPATTHGVGRGVQRERELASPGMCIGKQRLFEALGMKDAAAAPQSRARETYTTDPLAASVSPSEAYRLGAPSTVIIRTREGLGSGVVVDASGLVLTNHHVVDDFLQPDLTMNVSLEIAGVEPTGRVTRTGKTYQGVVLRADAVKDLALVRIKDPPKGLVPVKLASVDPQIGEDVVSIGHAGIGLLWAAKVCNVSGVGDQTHDTSMLEVGDCKLRDASDSEAEAKRRAEQCEARKRQVREMVAAATQGLAVQTSCNITHGDSGGPLLNLRGELVGLNESIRFDAATVAFHVHVAEIRAFMKDLPKDPPQVVPDPWCEGGSEATFEDVDGDGKKETLKLVGSTIGHRFGVDTAEATFVDLDGDDDPKKRTKARPFPADMILLHKHEDYFAFYDTDGDGTMDLFLRDKEGEGDVDLGWRLKSGHYEVDKSLSGKKIVDVAFVADPKHRARLGAVAQGLGWSKLASVETMAIAENVTVPDIFAGNFQMAGAMADGPTDKPFMVRAFGPGGDVTIVDTRSDELKALKNGDDARKLLETRALKPDFAMLGRPNGRWAIYDTDGDGKLDLALFARNPSDDERHGGMAQFATDAILLKDGKRAPEYVGRAVLRTKLIGVEKARKAMQGMGGSSDDGRSTFPKPYGGFARAPWKLSDLDGAPRRVLERMDAEHAVVMFDLDGDTKDLATKSADDFVRQQTFDWEAAIVRSGRLAWAYYDTNGDGAYDLVLFTRDVKKGMIDASYALDRTGEKVTYMPVAGTSFVQPERVTKNPKVAVAIRDAFTRILESMSEKEREKSARTPPTKKK